MKLLHISLLVGFALSLAPSTEAAVDMYRTEVQVSAGSFPNLQFAFDGDLNATSASQSLAISGALSEASSELNAAGYVPTLRTRATNSGAHSQAVAWGVQGFTNTTGSALTTSLFMDFSATVTGDNDVRAQILLFQDDNFEYYQDPGTILFESSSVLWDGFDEIRDTFSISSLGQPADVDEHRSFELTVAPGDSFYVWARLLSNADDTGVADAYSTLTASLSAPTGFTPAAVPEPGMVNLLAVGAVALFLRRRTRR